VKETPSHLKALEEIEREGIPGLVEVLREEGAALWFRSHSTVSADPSCFLRGGRGSPSGLHRRLLRFRELSFALDQDRRRQGARDG
jgi:hypothetical protein